MEPPKKPWELESGTNEAPPRPTTAIDSVNAGSVNRPMNAMYGSSPYGYNSGYGSSSYGSTGYGSSYAGGYGSAYGSGYGGGYGSGHGGGYGSYGGYNNYGGMSNIGGYNSGFNRQFDSNSLSTRMEQETQQTFATIQQIVQVLYYYFLILNRHLGGLHKCWSLHSLLLILLLWQWLV